MKWAGHSAVLHGCTVEDEAFVGMGATLLDGVVVGKHAMVAAGALVRQNTKIHTGEVVWTLFLGLCSYGHILEDLWWTYWFICLSKALSFLMLAFINNKKIKINWKHALEVENIYLS